MDRKAKRKSWWLNGSLGSVLLGFGLCCTVESGFLKHSGEAWWVWTIAGTLSLALVVSGVILLIKAGTLGHELKKNGENQFKA